MTIRKWFTIWLMLLGLVISCTALSEGILPSLDDVYGVVVPSFDRIVRKGATSTEVVGSTIEFTYTNVTDQDYYAYGEILKTAGGIVDGYSAKDGSVEVIISIKGKKFSFIYDSINATMKIKYPEGICDEKMQEEEQIYQSALLEYNKGNYSGAYRHIQKIPDYEKGQLLKQQVYFAYAKENKQRGEWKTAIKILRNIIDYPETQKEMQTIYNEIYATYIKENKIDDLSVVLQEADKDAILIDQFICYKPGDSGEGVQYLMNMLKDMGYMRKSDSKYKEEYSDIIIALETRLGVVADGIIYSDELISIYTTIYPGYKGSKVAQVLEHLVDAGYIRGPLPEDHQTYTKEYTTAVSKAKHAVGLNSDNLLTENDIEAIMKLPILQIKPVSALKASAKDPSYWNPHNESESDLNVTLSWKATKNALFYDIYRNGSWIATIPVSTEYRTKVPTNGKYTFSIVAKNYEYESERVNSEPVWVGPITVSINELLNNSDLYKRKNVSLEGNLRILSVEAENNSVYLLVSGNNGVIFCSMKNAKSRGFSVKDSILYCHNKPISEPSILFGKLTSNVRWINNYGDTPVFEIVHCIFFYSQGGGVGY